MPPPPILEERVSLEFSSAQFAQDCCYYFVVHHGNQVVLRSDEPAASRRPNFLQNRCDIVVEQSAISSAQFAPNNITVELFVYQKNEDDVVKPKATKLGVGTYTLDQDLEKLRNGDICFSKLSLMRRQGTTGKERPVGVLKICSASMTAVQHRNNHTCYIDVQYAEGFPDDSMAQARVMCESDQGGDWVVDHTWRMGQYHTARTSQTVQAGLLSVSKNTTFPWWVGKSMMLLVPPTMGGKGDTASAAVEISVLSKSGGHVLASACLSFAGVEYHTQHNVVLSWNSESSTSKKLYISVELRSSIEMDKQLFSSRLGRERLAMSIRQPSKTAEVQFNLENETMEEYYPGDQTEYTLALVHVSQSKDPGNNYDSVKSIQGTHWKSLFTDIPISGQTASVALALKSVAWRSVKLFRLGATQGETSFEVGGWDSKVVEANSGKCIAETVLKNSVLITPLEMIWCEGESYLTAQILSFTLTPKDKTVESASTTVYSQYTMSLENSFLMQDGTVSLVQSTQKNKVAALQGTIRAWSNSEMLKLTGGEEASKEQVGKGVEENDKDVEEASTEKQVHDETVQKEENTVFDKEDPVQPMMARSDISHLTLEKTLSFMDESKLPVPAHPVETPAGLTTWNENQDQDTIQQLQHALGVQEETLAKQDQVVASQLKRIQDLSEQLSKGNDERTQLRLTISQKDSTMASLVEEVNKRSNAIRSCGAEIVELRKRVSILEADNNKLRKADAKRQAINAGLVQSNGDEFEFEFKLDTREIEQAGEQELRKMIHEWHLRYVNESKRSKKITRHLGSMAKQRAHIRKLQDKIMQLELTHQTQNKVLNGLQDDKSKVKFLKLTVQTQEKVIDKLESMIEQQLLSSEGMNTSQPKNSGRNKTFSEADLVDGSYDPYLLNRIRELEDHIHELEEAAHHDAHLADRVVDNKSKNYDELEKQLVLNAKQFAKKLADLNFKIMELKDKVGSDDEEDEDSE